MPFHDLDALADARAAIDHLVGQDTRPIVVHETCNGAYLAFHALCRDERIQGAVLANLYCFDWDLTHDGDPFSAKPVPSVTAYADLPEQREALRRVFTVQTPVAPILAGILRRRFHKMDAALRPGARRETIEERIIRLRGRVAELVLLYSAGDLGLADLAPSSRRDTGGGCRNAGRAGPHSRWCRSHPVNRQSAEGAFRNPARDDRKGRVLQGAEALP